MMKKLLLIVFFIGWASQQTKAQDMIVDTFSTRGFPGLMSINMSPFSLTYFITTEKDKTYLRCRVLNDQLMNFMVLKQPVSKSTVVLAAIFIERGVAFFLGDPAAKTRTILAIDNMGKVFFDKKEVDVAPDLINASLPYYIFNSMPQGLLTITPVNVKTGAIKIARYDQTEKEVWHTDLQPDNGTLKLLSAEMNMENLMLLYKETSKDKTAYTIKTLAPNNVFMASGPLKSEDSYLFPVRLYNKDGRIFAGGRYYKDGKTDKNPSGIFGAMVGPDGVAMNIVKLPDGSLNKFLPEPIIAQLNDGAKLTVVDGYMSETGTMNLIGEVFRKTRGSQGGNITISHLMVIKMDNNGEVESLDLVPNIPTHEISVQGDVASMDDNSAMEWACKKQLFHDAFIVGPRPQYYLVYRTIDSSGINFRAVAADSIRSKDLKEKYTIDVAGGTPTRKILAKNNVIEATIAPGDVLGRWQSAGITKSEPENKMQVYIITEKDQLILRSLPREIFH